MLETFESRELLRPPCDAVDEHLNAYRPAEDHREEGTEEDAATRAATVAGSLVMVSSQDDKPLSSWDREHTPVSRPRYPALRHLRAVCTTSALVGTSTSVAPWGASSAQTRWAMRALPLPLAARAESTYR